MVTFQSSNDINSAFPSLFQDTCEFVLESDLGCRAFVRKIESTFLEEMKESYLSFCSERTHTVLNVLLKEGYVLDSILVTRSIVDVAVKFMLVSVSDESECNNISSELLEQIPAEQIRLRGLYKRILEADSDQSSLSKKAIEALAEATSSKNSTLSRNRADENIKKNEFQAQFKKLKERCRRQNVDVGFDSLELFYKISSNILHGSPIGLIAGEKIPARPVTEWSSFHFANAATVCSVLVNIWYNLERLSDQNSMRLNQRYEMAKDLIIRGEQMSE